MYAPNVYNDFKDLNTEDQCTWSYTDSHTAVLQDSNNLMFMTGGAVVAGFERPTMYTHASVPSRIDPNLLIETNNRWLPSSFS